MLLDRHLCLPATAARFDDSTRRRRRRGHDRHQRMGPQGLEHRGAPCFVGDGDPHRVARPHARITSSRRRRHLAERWRRRSGGAPMRRPGRRSGHAVRGADAHPSSLRRASSAPGRGAWPAAPVRARRTPSRRSAPATRNTSTRQSAAGAARFNRLTSWTKSGGIVVITAVERTLEKQPRDGKTACRRREREEEALREQLPDDAPA